MIDFKDNLHELTPDELLAYNAILSELRQRIRAEQLRVNAVYSEKMRTNDLARVIGVGTVEGTRHNGNA